MKEIITTLFVLIVIVKIVSVDLAFHDDPNTTDSEKYPVVFLSLPSKIIKSKPILPAWKAPILQIYCFRGVPRYWLNTFTSVYVDINLDPEEYGRYDGANPQEVVTAYEEKNVFWSLNLFSWKERILRANPDGGSCFGIHGATRPYEILLFSEQIDYWKLGLLVSGIVLYLLAPRLSQNTLFYYLCGIVCGVCLSLLMLVYFANRLITLPQGPMIFYGSLALTWFAGVRLMQLLWGNIRLIVSYQWPAFVTYIAVTSIISAATCYRLGPVSNPRTRNLIQWAMQAGSVYLMYLSSEFQDAIIVIITLILVVINFPRGLPSRVSTYWKQQLFTSKCPRRLLTLEEFRQEGVEYTAQSLEELRRFCASPACNQWATVNNLKVPSRVAVFVTGSPHVSPAEKADHRRFTLNGTHQTNDMEVSDDSDF